MLEFLLAAVVLILFYKLVRREHKVLLLKWLGGLAILAGLAGAVMAFWYYSQEQEYRTAAAMVSIDIASVTPDTAAFSVCNDASRDLHRVRFSVSGIERGRSTLHSIVDESNVLLIPPLPNTRSTSFSWDLVVRPGVCITASYTPKNLRQYKAYPRYEITVDTIIFADEPSVGQASAQPDQPSSISTGLRGGALKCDTVGLDAPQQVRVDCLQARVNLALIDGFERPFVERAIAVCARANGFMPNWFLDTLQARRQLSAGDSAVVARLIGNVRIDRVDRSEACRAAPTYLRDVTSQIDSLRRLGVAPLIP